MITPTETLNIAIMVALGLFLGWVLMRNAALAHKVRVLEMSRYFQQRYIDQHKNDEGVILVAVEFIDE